MKSLTVLIFCTVLAMSAGYKILGIMPVPGRSHYYPFAALMKGLARKGHDITFISYFKEKGPPSNYREITLKLDDSKRSLSELFSFEDLKKLFGDSDTDTFFFKLFNVFALDEMAERTCMVDIHSEVIRKFANEKQTFDAVIVEAFHSDCFMGFAHLYGAPLIKFTASLPFPWYNWRLGQPSNPSYVQNVMSGFSAPLTFSQRLQNTVFDIFHRFYIECVRDPTHYEAAKKFYPDGTPGLYEISSNASLSLVNTHYTYLGSKPLNPNVVEVGGIHVTLNKPQPVPKNIENWINESEHGVIYFSMGSMIKGHTFPEDKRKIFLRAFGRLKQRVLWKWENDTMPGKPDNVMIQKWMPQFDILCHPNVKAFISHGGLLGTTEAVHCGVPVVVMPQFGDQHTNAKALEAGNGGVILNFREADEEAVYKALTTVLDPEFNKKAKELSARFRDRPMSPMDTAIYWIEYVARHKGAHHMRTAAVGMPLYQYLLLDVFAFLALVAIVALLVVFYTLKFLLSFLKSFFVPQKKLKSQ